MDYKEMIAVLQAAQVGKRIQSKSRASGETYWRDNAGPSWDFALCDYRVKPEPREWFACLYANQDELQGGLFPTEERARKYSINREIIRVREVID